jgi:hypothetical protein
MRTFNAQRLALRIGPEAVAAGLGLLAAVIVAGPSLGEGFPLDDAWIHMVYGSALRHTGALQYNDGQSSAGCTSPVWAFAVALAHLVAGATGPSLRTVAWVQGFGIAAHVVQAILAACLARAWAPELRWAPAMALGGGALVACAPTLGFAAASGMEVPLEGALLLGAMLAAVSGRWIAAGAIAGIAAVTRPEGVLAVIAIGVLAATIERPLVALGALGAGAVPVLARVARDWSVSGRPLPATFYVKANPGADPIAHSLARGFVNVLGGMRPASHIFFWVCVATAIGLGAVAMVQRVRHGRRLLTQGAIGAAAAIGLAYSAGISVLYYMQLPRSFYYQRYLAPPLTLMTVAGYAALAWFSHMALHSKRRMAVALPCLLAALAVGDEMAAWGMERARFAGDVAAINALQVTIGRWIDSNLPPGAVVWSVDAGAIRYWGRHPTVDLIRLNTPELFDGPRVKKAWWPTAVAVITNIFQVVTPESLLDIAFVAETPGESGMWHKASRHEVYRCRPDSIRAQDNRVMVVFQERVLLSVGRCVP